MDDVSGVPRMWTCAPKTWYVIERPGTFLKHLPCSRKSWLVLENAVMCTQLMTDTLLQIITRFLCLRIIFMDDVSGVPRMWICSPKTWYVIERPGTFLKDLACSRKSWLVLENAVMCTQLMTDNLL